MCDTHIIHGHGYIKECEAVCVPRHISQSPDSWQKIFSRFVCDFRKRRHLCLLKQNKRDKGQSRHQSWGHHSRKHYWIPCPFNRLAGSPAGIPKPCPNTVNARPALKTSPWESQGFVCGSCGNVLTILFCKSWGSSSSVAEESGLLGRDLVLLGKWFPTFLCNKVPSYSRFKHQDKYIFLGQLDPLHLEHQEPLIQQHSITSQNTWIFNLLLCPTCF